MQNLQPKKTSTLDLINSDVALFPIIEKPGIKKVFHLDLSREKILGIADLPPIFAHRINLFNTYGKTFVGKNYPLTFSIFDHTEPTTPPISEYWNQIMGIIRNGACPKIWIIAPQFFCEYVLSQIGDTKGFYYHNNNIQKQHHYYLVTNSDKIRTHILFSEY